MSELVRVAIRGRLSPPTGCRSRPALEEATASCTRTPPWSTRLDPRPPLPPPDTAVRPAAEALTWLCDATPARSTGATFAATVVLSCCALRRADLRGAATCPASSPARPDGPALRCAALTPPRPPEPQPPLDLSDTEFPLGSLQTADTTSPCSTPRAGTELAAGATETLENHSPSSWPERGLLAERDARISPEPKLVLARNRRDGVTASPVPVPPSSPATLAPAEKATAAETVFACRWRRTLPGAGDSEAALKPTRSACPFARKSGDSCR